eukprot:4617463-Karenia_brevis.AAC.1
MADRLCDAVRSPVARSLVQEWKVTNKNLVGMEVDKSLPQFVEAVFAQLASLKLGIEGAVAPGPEL